MGTYIPTKVISVTWEQLENPKNKKSIEDQRLWDHLVPILRGNFGLEVIALDWTSVHHERGPTI